MPEHPIDVRAVQELVRHGRVLQSPRYHAGRRGISWVLILNALEHCYHVERDGRRDGSGNPAHRDGWFALANLAHRRRLRIDFDVAHHEQTTILVVTAYHT